MDDQLLWRNTLISPDTTIGEAVRRLDETAMQIVLVVSGDGTLIGTVTDGDIRRGLLKGLDLQSSVDSVAHRDAFVVPPAMSRESVVQIMQANKLHQLPVVDEMRRVVGLHTWDELNERPQLSNVMVIMAGGFGTRLHPHTVNCPKPLLPVAGKPMMEHIIEQAIGDGFQRFIVSTHYLAHMIEDYFGDGGKWGVSIEYIHETRPLGTAGGLALLKDRVHEPFVVTNGDVLTDIRYCELLDFHMRYQAEATMAVRLYEWQHPFGVVEIQGVEIIGLEEKPIARSHVNAGIYVLNPEVLGHLNADERCDMPVLFEALRQNRRRTVAYPMHEPWLDLGRPDDLEKANNHRKSGCGRRGVQ